MRVWSLPPTTPQNRLCFGVGLSYETELTQPLLTAIAEKPGKTEELTLIANCLSEVESTHPCTNC